MTVVADSWTLPLRLLPALLARISVRRAPTAATGWTTIKLLVFIIIKVDIILLNVDN